MLVEPTVLVLGAGASFEFGLPVGGTLAKQIQDRLTYEFDFQITHGDADILQAMQKAGLPPATSVPAATKIAAALPTFKSIDDCLHSHSHNEAGVLAGKMAIGRCIADAEANSKVAPLWRGDQEQRDHAAAALRGTWAGALVTTLVTGVRRSDYRQIFHDLTIVSFNYDRCIEAVLFHLIQAALDIDQNQAAEAMEGLKVYHPYGSLGPLWRAAPGLPAVQFAPKSLDLNAAAERLFVYTEPRDQPDDVLEMKRAVAETERMVFLGFGFHSQNVELLAGGAEQVRGKQMLGTVLHEPVQAVEVYKARLAQRLGVAGPWELVGVDCTQFMNRYAAVLSR